MSELDLCTVDTKVTRAIEGDEEVGDGDCDVHLGSPELFLVFPWTFSSYCPTEGLRHLIEPATAPGGR